MELYNSESFFGFDHSPGHLTILGGGGPVTEFIIEQISPTSGLRQGLPFHFSNREEATALAAELSGSNPGFLFVVKVVPAA